LKIANPYVGDGVANILMMEAIMRDMDYNIHDVMKLYTESPSLMSKCKVKDRSSFKTTWEEHRLIEPQGLQDEIDMMIEHV
jgi:phosphoacetylglucosamine mutase